MREHFVALKLLIFLKLFSIAPCNVIAVNHLCFIFGVSPLLLFFIAHIVSAPSTIHIVLAVAHSLS